MKYKNLYFGISLFFLVPGIISLVVFGLRPAIDFTGGSLIELRVTEDFLAADKAALQEVIGEAHSIDIVQSSGESQVIIRGKDIDNQTKNLVIDKLRTEYGQLEELRFETVGPVLGRELVSKTLTAVAIVSVLITLYVWKQFKELKYGVCAILAMFHDSLILLGSFSLLGYFFGVEVDVLFVTALLTTLSFSIHDTIVVYDRIRELRKYHPNYSLETLINKAVLETLARSINNSVTIIIMLLALVMLGGDSTRWFAVALLIGAVTGTYSSTFTAAPLLLLWERVFKDKK